jgi:hypothetical protein
MAKTPKLSRNVRTKSGILPILPSEECKIHINRDQETALDVLLKINEGPIVETLSFEDPTEQHLAHEMNFPDDRSRPYELPPLQHD